MKAANAKKSTTTSRTATQAANPPFFSKAGGGNFFAPVNRAAAPSVQMKMAVNKPGDTFEQEADKMAGKVMRMPTPAASEPEEKVQRQEEDQLQKQDDKEIQKTALPEEQVQKQEKEEIQKVELTEEQVQKQEKEEIQKAELPEEQVQKQEDEEVQRAEADKEEVQRKGNGAPAVNAGTQSAIRSKTTGGQPLSGDVRSFMEPRFNADFSNVRVHNDAESAGLSNQLSARAFTYQNHIFFSRDQYQPGTSDGKQLLAHELTHTVQQGHSVQRSPQITTTATTSPVQRSFDFSFNPLDSLRNFFAKRAHLIPGFRLLTIIMGFNPINNQSVDRNAANILRAMIELIPGGNLITQALDNHGVFTKAGEWVEQQLTTLGDIGSGIVDALKEFIRPGNLLNFGSLWERVKNIFTTPIRRIKSFAIGMARGIMQLVKDAILKPLAALAKGTKGYDLLCALLGEDPITSKPVPRNAETLIGGFMKLIGREDLWKNLKKANAVPRAWAWFQKTWVGLLAFARSIPGRITATLDALNAQDILTIAGAFKKVVGTFAGIAGEFISWGVKQVVSLLEILFSVVAPSVMPYLKKAKGAFVTILKNPIGFAGNLVRAGKLGFQMFAGNILKHLKTALIKWITGPLGKAGVYIPKSFSLMEIIKLVLSVLGLTWQNIRQKLVKIIPDPILTGLEKTAGVLVTLVKDGPVAAWEQIKSELSELKDQLISQVTEMVTTKVVQAAVTKLGTMLNPAGAVIQSIISIYNTITFFIERAGQMASVVGSFINSISAIAAGRVKNAATRVEQTMAKTLNVVLAFLANFAGLDNIPKKIVAIIQKIRKPIDKGMDKIVAWLGNMLKKLVKKGKAAIVSWWKKKRKFKDKKGCDHKLYFKDKSGQIMVASKDPKGLQHQIKDRRAAQPPLKPVQKGKLTKADKLYDEVKAATKRYTGDPKKDPELNKEIEKLLARIEVLMVDGDAWGGNQELPPTKVKFTPESDVGSKVEARPLTRIPGNTVGTKADSSLLQPKWNAVLGSMSNVRGGSNNWNRTHLLADRLHGPGNDWRNLIPGTNNLNGELASTPEKEAYQHIKNGETIAYTVQVMSWYAGNFIPYEVKAELHTYNPAKPKDKGTKLDGGGTYKNDPPTHVPYSLSVNQQAVIKAYEALQRMKGSMPTQKEVGNQLGLDKSGISRRMSAIRGILEDAKGKSLSTNIKSWHTRAAKFA